MPRPAFDAAGGLEHQGFRHSAPAVLSIWNSTSDKFPNFSKQGDHDWVLDAKAGDTGISIILIGKVEA